MNTPKELPELYRLEMKRGKHQPGTPFPVIEQAVFNNLPQHAWNDRYEVRQTEKRSLSQLQKTGVAIALDPTFSAALQAKENGVCALLDVVKNERVATINGMPESKVSLIIHDVFDHFYTFTLLQEQGILERYHEFLQSVGNPQLTDIYKREGELIASPVFEWRKTLNPNHSYTFLFSLDKMKRIVSEDTPNQKRATSILDDLKPEDKETKDLQSVYKGVLIELMEQRRKHGFIKKLDKNYQVIDNMPILDAEYLALVIEINHMLTSSLSVTKTALLRTELLVESYLQEMKNGGSPTGIITLEDITHRDPQAIGVGERQREWIENNLYHTSLREDSCYD